MNHNYINRSMPDEKSIGNNNRFECKESEKGRNAKMDVRSILKVQKASPLHEVNQDEISNKSNIINDENEREDAENNLSVTCANDNDIIFVTRENSNLDKCELNLHPGINSNTVMNESQEKKKQVKSSKRSYGKHGLSKSSVENEEIIAKGGKCARVKFNSQKSATKSRVKRRNSEDTEQPSPLSISTSNSSSPSADGSCSEDNSSYGQFSQAVPPDGGWGWVVVAASFMVNLIADGITFSFGVIFVEFLNYFGEGKSKTAWIGSLFMAMPLLSGPVASFLTDRYGCRRVSIAGSILATCGFVVSSFTKSMGVLILTFGVVAGFGLSLCFVAAVVIVAYYFDKRRSFATGLSVCGSGIGTFIFPPLTQYLLAEYGWRGTTLILAGFFFNLAVCGCLMRDLEWTTVRAKAKSEERKRNREKKRTIKIQSSSVDSFSASSSANTANITHHTLHTTIDGVQRIHIENDASKVFSSLLNLPTFIKNGDQVPLEVLDLLAMRKDVSNALFHNYPTLLTVSRSFSESTPITDAMINYPNIVETEQLTKTQTMCQNITDNDVLTTTHTFNNNIHHHENDIETIGDNNPDDVITANHWWLNKLQMDNSFKRSVTFEVQRRIPPPCLNNMRMQRHSLTYRGAMLNINRYRLRASSCPDIYRNSISANDKTKLVWYSGLWEFWDLLVDMLDFSHFTDSRFLLFSISNFLLHTWYDVPYVYLTDNAIEMGYSETDASILISIIGIANMFGEILLGWAGDIACVNASIVYAICMIICGAITSLIPLAVFNYYILCSVSGAFGIFIAANYSLTSIILVEVITLERFTNAYGLLLLVQGIANLMGPPLAGWLYDITGTYDLSFYLAGFFIALSGVLLMVVPLTSLYKKCTKKNNITNVDFVGTDNV